MKYHIWRRRLVTWLIVAICPFAFVEAAAETETAKTDTQPGSGDKPTATAPTTQPAAATRPAEPETVPLSFKDAPLDQIAKFLTEQMGKPVLINEEVKKIKITLVNPKTLPVDEAMYVLATALHEHSVAIEQREHTVHLIPIDEIIRRQIKTVPAGVDVTTITPTNGIVRKVFAVKYYDPAKLIDVLKPLLPKYGHITADPTTKKLIVVASVERLIIMSQIIKELDEPDVSGGELRVFHLDHVDVYEIIPMLEKLIAGYLGVDVKAVSSSGGASGSRKPGPKSGNPRPPEGKPGSDTPSAAAAATVAVKAGKTPVLLIPEPRRSQIVVAAPTDVLAQIEVWLLTLDQPRPPSTKWEIVEIKHGDAGELTSQLTDMLKEIPDESFRSALQIFPFVSSRRLMIVGSEQNREIIKEWIVEIDVADVGKLVQRTFILKYADAAEVASNVKELFGEDSDSGYRSYYYYRYAYGQRREEDKVAVTANTRRNSITVQAAPVTMERIARQIEEWDKPLKGDEAAPLIITLKYADPETTKELLENLFTRKESQRTRPWYYYDYDEEAPSPVGRLFGQFRFEAYPETGKLIVVSKNEENYEVIKRIITQIDSPQEAGLPRTILLKFADAETVAEQLNALLNAPGTPTSILRRGRLKGFEQFADDRSPYSQETQTQARPAPSGEQDEAQSVMNFWWQQPPSRDIKARQPSNLVGKLRIVPNIERNMLLVAVPEEYADALEELIKELDRPGYQVLIKAVIAEITHDDSMSLGFRFSTDPTLFTSGDPLITENSLRGLFEYQFQDTHANTHTFTVNADVNGLLSLLGKVTDLKIKSEPAILTADNVEGEFFDGQDIPFIQNARVLDVGTSDTFDYFPVGITLRVRPHITEEKTINLTVKLRVSSVVPGRTLFGGAIVDRRETTTQITLEHGRPFMISGILREEQREIIRRVPGLSDIPLLGELFKHRETAKVNAELLVLLTPYVIGPKGDDLPRDEIETGPQERMEQYWPESGVGQTPGSPEEPADQARAPSLKSVVQGG